jgi:hypothetical protein
MPSTDTKPELTAKASMAQPVSHPAVYANGLKREKEVEGVMKQRNLTYEDAVKRPNMASENQDLSATLD